MENLFAIAQLIIGDNRSAKEVLKLGYQQNEIETIIKLQSLLNENDWKCNADGRAFVANRLTEKLTPREFGNKKWLPVLKYAEEVGGFITDESFDYPNAQGNTSTARVCGLYNLPREMVNPYLVTFGGVMHAPLFGMEILRFHAKQTGKLLPLLCIGKGGNKGLFEKVFNRSEGLIRGTEYEAYLNIYEQMAPTDYVRTNQKVFEDMDTAGNLLELHRFACEQGLKEVTYVLCTGNPFYDKRLLAEWMLMLKEPIFADVKINLVLAHCPLFLGSAIPEGNISEILLGYVAASIGPLMKDTVPFGSDQPGERYLMPGVKEADWSVFEEVISCFSNMGWPNYMEILYNTDHKVAVSYIILSDLYARQSFSAENYDFIEKDITDYICHLGGKYKKGDFLQYLKNTDNQRYF